MSRARVSNENELLEQRLLLYLRKSTILPGWDAGDAPLRVEQLDGGQSNPTYVVHLPSRRRVVLRKKPNAVKVKSAHAVEREYQVLRALADSDVPVPDVFHLCEDDSVIGSPFYLMEYLEGRIFRDPSLPGVAAEERPAYYRSMLSTLVCIHKFDWRHRGLEGYGRDGGYFPRQLRRLREVMNKQAEDAGHWPGLQELSDDLIGIAETSGLLKDEVALVHGDYKVDNVVFHRSEPRVIGVLDWELSTIGHPMADLANLMMMFYIPAGPMPVPGLLGLDLEELNIPDEETMLKWHSEMAQRPYPDPVWRLYTSFLFFKNAVVLHGISARLKQGVAASKMASKLEGLGPALIDISRQHLAELPRRGPSASLEQSSWLGKNAQLPLALVFDVGGVITKSPLIAIRDFERAHHIPKGYISVAIESSGPMGLFQRLERGEERLTPHFLVRFREELVSPTSRAAYRSVAHKRTGVQVEDGQLPRSVDTPGLFRAILGASCSILPGVVERVRLARGAGFRVAALTNDFRLDGSAFTSMAATEREALAALEATLKDPTLFETVVSSADIGARKPEERAYREVCTRLGVSPQSMLFLDDIGRNVKAARNLGMHTFLVQSEEQLTSLLDELIRARSTTRGSKL